MKKKYEEKTNKSMSKSLFYIFVSFIVLVVSTWTWYVNNTKVGGEELVISASGSRFEIVTRGDGDDVSSTSSTMDWMLSSTSNIGNYSPKLESGKIEEPKGIEPGDYGSLTFYIKPNVNDIKTLSYSFDIIPCEEASDDEIEFTAKYGENNLNLKKQNNERLSNLLSGHILFFQEREETDGKFSYKNPIGSDKISVNCTNLDENGEVEVTIYWVWPLQVDYYINQGDLFADVDQVTDMVEKMNNNQGLYFYNPEDEDEPLPDNLVVDELKEMETEDITQLKYYYNWGDQYIGQNATFTKITVTVQE